MLDNLIQIGYFLGIVLLVVLFKYISDGVYDFFDRLHGCYVYQMCKKKGDLHQPNNKWYIWWASHRLMNGNDDISWLTYEKHFIDGNFYYK